jgi:hypothetical protein
MKRKCNWPREQEVARHWLNKIRAILQSPADPLRSASGNPRQTGAEASIRAAKPPLQGQLFSNTRFRYRSKDETDKPGYLARRFEEINRELAALNPPPNAAALRRKEKL